MERSSNKTREASAPPATKTQKLEREIDRLAGENEAQRTRAEREGSLFDLNRGTVKDIARAIAANMTFELIDRVQGEPRCHAAATRAVIRLAEATH